MTRFRPDPDQAADEASALEQCLKNAYAPSELDERVHQDLLARALVTALPGAHVDANSARSGADAPVSTAELRKMAFELDSASGASNDAENGGQALDEGPSSEEEHYDAARLAKALDGHALHPLAPLAVALQAAYSPSDITSRRARELQDDAIRRHPQKLLRVFGYASALIAAAVGLVFGWSPQTTRDSSRQSSSEQLIVSRSVTPLLREMEQSTATNRIDRIYSMRSRELRHNRFITWGVR